jgi:hypothetical protein
VALIPAPAPLTRGAGGFPGKSDGHPPQPDPTEDGPHSTDRTLGKAKLPPAIKRQPNWREVREGAMDELAYFHQIDAATLIHGALFMMLWLGGIVALDYWVGALRSDSPRRGPGRPT